MCSPRLQERLRGTWHTLWAPRAQAVALALVALVLAGWLMHRGWSLRRHAPPGSDSEGAGTPPPGMRADLAHAERFAVIAALDEAPWRRPLRCAEADARALRDTLVGSYGYRPDHLRVLLPRPRTGEAVAGAPETEALLGAIRELGALTRQRRDSSFLFYFAGHGDAVGQARDAAGLVTADGVLSIEALLRTVDLEIAAERTLLLLDACQAGRVLEQPGSGGPEGRAVVVITAGSAAQPVYEDPVVLGHSLFASALLEALAVGVRGHPSGDRDGDGALCDVELLDALTTELAAPSAAGVAATAQTPGFLRWRGGPASARFCFLPAEHGQTGAGPDAP